jgi:hypothetical protein
MLYYTTRAFPTASRQYEAGDAIDPANITAVEWIRGTESGAVVPARWYGTAAVLAARGIPGPGVQVYETDTRITRVGDGTTSVASLPQVGSSTYGQLRQVVPSVKAPSGRMALLSLPAAPTTMTPIITDPTSAYLTGSGDGPKFFSILKTAGRVSSPLDAYYGWVGGHDSDGIYHLTAPTPAGPWTWRTKVMSNALSGGLIAGSECSTPEVIYWGGQLLMYFHGKLVADIFEFATLVSTSTDGITWSTPTVAMRPKHATNIISYYGTSTEYVRVTDAGGYLIATFQANHYPANAQCLGYKTVAVGWAKSYDGITWKIARQPLITNLPAVRGVFAPQLFRAQGMWCVLGYVPDPNLVPPGNLELWASTRLEAGTFNRVGVWQNANNAPYTWLDMPQLFWDDDGTCHYYVGYTDATYTIPAQIRHGVLDWSA